MFTTTVRTIHRGIPRRVKMSNRSEDIEMIAATRSVLIDVLTILGKFREKMVVVGGWVPELYFPDSGHIGSLAVDLALDPEAIPNYAYETINRELTQRGYSKTDITN